MPKRPAILATSIALILSHFAAAQTATGWLGADDSAWNNPLNWDNGAPPGGDTNTRNLFFGAGFVAAGGTGSTTANNNLVGYLGHRINFEDTATDPQFTITGNAFSLLDFGGNAPAIVNSSSSVQTFALGGALTLNGGAVGYAEIHPTGGNLLFSNAIVLGGTTQLRVLGTAGHELAMNGAISGSNSVAINGNTNVVYGAANTYSGDTFINAGSLNIAQGGSLSAGTIQLGDTNATGADATLRIVDLDGGTTVARPIVVRAGSTGVKTLSASNTAGVNTFSGTITLNDGATADVAPGGALTASGVISGTGRLTKTGDGLLTLSGANTFSGGIAIDAGTARLTAGNTITGGITVNTGGTLETNVGAADSAAFTNLFGTAANTITLDGGRLLDTNNADRTLTNRAIIIGASGGTIEIRGILNDFIESGTITQLRLATASPGISSILSGSGTLVKDGGGRLTLNSGSSPNFSGAWIINDGTVETTGVTLGNASATNTVTLNGGILSLTGTSNQPLITLNGGALAVTSGNRTVNGRVDVTNSSYMFLNDFWRDFDSAAPTANIGRNIIVAGQLTGDDPLGIAVNRTNYRFNNGTVILQNATNTYSGTLTVGKNLRLESNPTGGVGSALGVADVVLAEGTLVIRDNGPGSDSLLPYGNNVTVTTPTDIFNRGTLAGTATIDVNRASGTNTNNTIFLGSLEIGDHALKVNAGNGYGVTFAAASTLTGNATFDVNGGSLSFSDWLDGGAVPGRSVTKTGDGVLRFGNETRYTGATTVNNGTLVLSDSGALIGTSAISLGEGAELVIDNSALTLADRVEDATPITMLGGALTVQSEIGSATDTFEAIGPVTLLGGSNTIEVNQNNAGAMAVLTMASFTRQGGATINFDGSNLGIPGNSARIVIANQAATPFFGAWATVGHSYASYDPTMDNGVELGISAVSAIEDPTNDSILEGTLHLRLIESDLALTDDREIMTVTFANPTAGRDLNTGTHTLSLMAGGLLSGPNSATISGTGGIITETPELVITNAGALGIAAPLHDGANPVAVVKSGPGTLTLSGASTFTGGISISEGALVVSQLANTGLPSNLGADGTIAMSTGAVPTTLQLTGSGSSTDRALTIGTHGVTVDVPTGAATFSFSGAVAGGPVTKIGAGTLSLSGTANLTGNVDVTAGTLSLAAATVEGDANVTAGSTLRIAGPTVFTGDLNVGINGTTGNVTSAAGGSLKVGSGSANNVYVGVEAVAVGTSSTGNVDLSDLSNFTANVGSIYVGSTITLGNNSGVNGGTLILAQNNDITASAGIIVAESNGDGANATRLLRFGSGINNVATPVLTVGGRKYSGTANIAPGGVLNLGSPAARTVLNVGANTADTGTQPTSVVDLSGGTVVASLGQVTVGLRTGGGTVGRVTSTLNLGTSDQTNVNISVATGIGLRIGQYEFTGGTQPTSGQATGTVIIGGGNVNIASANSGSSSVLVGYFNNTGTAISGAAAANSATGTLTIDGGAVNIAPTSPANAINIAQRTIVASSVGTNTVTGTVNLNGGSLTVAGPIVGNGSTANAASTSNLNITGGLLNMQGRNITNITNLTFSGGTIRDLGTLNRSLTQTGNASLVEVLNNNTTISGAFDVTDGDVHVGATRVLNATGGTVLNGSASATVNGSLTGSLTVNAGATVGGSGTTQALTLAGGTIAPGTSPGILGTGNLALGGGTLAFEFLNNTPGTGYDQINVTGAVSLSQDTALTLAFGYIPQIGEAFTLINNDLSDTVAFSNGALFTYGGNPIADDATFSTIEGYEFRLDYNGGTNNNDVVLTTLVPEPGSALMLLAGLGAMVVARRRTRQG